MLLAAPHPRLISTAELARLLDARTPLTVIDIREDVFTYLESHLPGAAYVHVEGLRATRDGLPSQLLSPAAYVELFTRLGIRIDRPVVIYSAGESRDIDATFLAWLLASFGHPAVYLLDGGYFAWQVEHRPLTQKYPPKVPGRFPSRPFRPEAVTLAELRAALGRPGTVLVDARSPEQYAGQAGAQLRRGHIPGAINHPWKSDLERREFGNVWKRPEELRASYEAQGITPDKDVIVYCNTGTEASHVHFALRYLLGYPRVRIYTGAWNEWSEREDLPVAAGAPRAAGGN